MRKLPKTERYEFGTQYDAYDSFLVENKRGDLFFGGYDGERKGLCLHRWREGEGWQDLGRFSGGGGLGMRGLIRPQDVCYEADCPEQGELAFLVQEEIRAFSLLRLDYDGRICVRTELDRSRSYQWISSFPDGDVLLSAQELGQGEWMDLAIRLSPRGEERWVYHRPIPTRLIEWGDTGKKVFAPGGMKRALAMADGTTLLWVEDEAEERSGILHMEHLDREGRLMDVPADPGFSHWGGDLPQVCPEEGGWSLIYGEEGMKPGNFNNQVRFTRVCLDRGWRITGQECTQLLVLGSFFQTTRARSVPGGILTASTVGRCIGKGELAAENWIIQTSFGGEPHRVMVRQEEKRPKWLDFDMPIFRREDGTFVLLLSAPGSRARFEAAGVSPAGEIFWKKNFSCEGKRWFFLRGERLVVVLSSILGEAWAETLNLP